MTALPPKLARDPRRMLPEVLPSEDNENMESSWHRDQMNLLIDSLRTRWADRRDFFCGGNMFVHFSTEQVWHRDFRGPDFFVVLDVDRDREPPREYWAVWEEGGRYPDFILELLSPTTETADRTTKLRTYERTFRTPEYFLYSPYTQQIEGFRLAKNHRYEPIVPEGERFWSETLDCWIGLWNGPFASQAPNRWLRMFEKTGELVPVGQEYEAQRAEMEKQRAEAEKLRADAMAEENARLKAELDELRKSKP